MIQFSIFVVFGKDFFGSSADRWVRISPCTDLPLYPPSYQRKYFLNTTKIEICLYINGVAVSLPSLVVAAFAGNPSTWSKNEEEFCTY